MGNRPYQEPFIAPDSSGPIPVSEVWQNFRRHERALAFIGVYFEDLIAPVLKDEDNDEEETSDQLNMLKSRTVDRWRISVGHDSSAPSVDDLSSAVAWVRSLTIADIEELSVAYDSEEEEKPMSPWFKYPLLVAVGAVLEYAFTHWVHP